MSRESELLKEWALEARTPPNFNSGVWRRIEERRTTSRWEMVHDWINELFSRRAVALGYISIAFAVGLVAAHFHSSSVLRERESQLEARYLQSVDPYTPRTPK